MNNDLFKDYNITEINEEDIFNEVLSNEDIKEFVYSNDLTHDEIKSAMNIFLEYIDDTSVLSNNLRESKKYPGYYTHLSYEGGVVKKSYKPNGRINFKPSLFKAMEMPEELFNVDIEDFSLATEDRRKVYNYARLFISSFGSENQMKGLYISGPFRTGKTYIASAIGLEIAKKGYKVIEAYYPELSSTLKSTFGYDTNNNFLDIVDELKKCDLLILDDLGGETLNQTVRDEALGVVLQHRMVKNKATIITSNLRISQLMNSCLRRDGSEQETVKAGRILERIKELTREFSIVDRFVEK